MSRPLGVILAGGQATRMGGGDKGLLPLGDGTILSHVIDRLAPQVAGLALNANGDPARFDACNLPVLPDSIADFPGPLAGVLAGLDWAAAQGAETIVTVAADTPFFPRDLVARLLEVAQGMTHPLVLAATPRPENERTRSLSRSGLIRHPTFGLWPVALRDDLRAALNDGLRKVVLWTEKHDGREALFDDPGDPFFNVNTPEDLQQARAMRKDSA
ncbi:molybdenum cofactor guanylyltransferase MobA [Roseovarius pacificus]|uniref:molybdenum cofactor guanylyltransferase MobA n=1 Tax=Roseovarius pacificus TaxID=337701 RepID=UPI004039D1A3